jgi:hypothetical protein
VTKYYRYAARIPVLLKSNHAAVLQLNQFFAAHVFAKVEANPFSALVLQACDL